MVHLEVHGGRGGGGGNGNGFTMGLGRWPQIWVAIGQSLGRI